MKAITIAKARAMLLMAKSLLAHERSVLFSVHPLTGAPDNVWFQFGWPDGDDVGFSFDENANPVINDCWITLTDTAGQVHNVAIIADPETLADSFGEEGGAA